MSVVSAAGNEGFIWILWGLLSLVPFAFVIRFFLHDGQMIGVHRTSWFVGIVYVLGIVTSAFASWGRALMFNYVPLTTASDVQVNIWLSAFSFSLLNVGALILWPILARRVNVKTLQILVQDWKGTAAVGLAAVLNLLEWILFAVLSFGTQRLLPDGTGWFYLMPYLVWHLFAAAGFVYYVTTDRE